MSLAVSGYVKQLYKGNIFGATAAERKGYDTRSLIAADMQATKRALKELRGYDYNKKKETKEEEEDVKELRKRVQAYVNTYNNFIDSTGEIIDDDLERSLTKLKKMTKKQKDLLSSIGIGLKNNGKLVVDTDQLENISKNKIRKVFTADADYGIQVEKHMKRIWDVVRRKNLGVPTQSVNKAAEKTSQSEEDARLAEKLAEALEGRQINYSI